MHRWNLTHQARKNKGRDHGMRIAKLTRQTLIDDSSNSEKNH